MSGLGGGFPADKLSRNRLYYDALYGPNPLVHQQQYPEYRSNWVPPPPPPPPPYPYHRYYAPQPPPQKPDMMELMMMQSAQLNQAIMQNMLLERLAPPREEPKPVVYYVQQPPMRLPPRPNELNPDSPFVTPDIYSGEFDPQLALYESHLAGLVPYDPYLGYPKGMGSADADEQSALFGGRGSDGPDPVSVIGGGVEQQRRPKSPPATSAATVSASKVLNKDDVVEVADIPPPPSQ
ncbi:synaptic defective enhancer 1-like isoform X1 [Symsagittifera roscoffensis]|uniref:synaptic defective enhancer 1-like isoform X1 n=1 Tax=Symsagittifera roscoffensis TaxID=84072 RepID=UPI00307C5D4F